MASTRPGRGNDVSQTSSPLSPATTVPTAANVPSHDWRARVRWLLFSLVFFGVPLLLATHACNVFWSAEEANRRDTVVRRLDRVMGVFDAAIEPELYLEQLLQELDSPGVLAAVANELQKARRRAMRKGRRSPREFVQVWPALRRNLARRFPGLFQFVIFDHRGNVVPELSDRIASTTPYEAFWRDTTRQVLSKTSDLTDNYDRYRALIGPLLRTHGNFQFGLKLTSYQQPKNYLFVSEPSRSHYSILCHVRKGADWDGIGLRDRARAYNILHGPIRAAIVDSTRSEPFAPGWSAAEVAALPEVVRLFGSNPSNYLQYDGRWWSQRVVSSTNRVILAVADVSAAALQQRRVTLALGISALFGLLALGAWHLMLGPWSPYVSIRAKLMLLFLFVVGLPLSVMGLEAFNYVRERRLGLENRIWLENERALLLFDRKLPLMLGEAQRIMRRIFLTPIANTQRFVEIAIRRALRAQSLTRSGTAELIDERGKMVMPEPPGGNRDGRKAISMLKQVYVQISRSLNNQAPELNDLASTQLSAMASAFGVDVEYLIAEIARTVTRVIEMRLAEKRSVQAVFPLADKTGFVRLIGVFHWHRPTMERSYVKRHLTRAARQLTDTEFYADSRRPGDCHPFNFRFRSELGPFIRTLQSQTGTLRGRIRIKGEEYLLTGVRGQELVEFSFVAMTSCRRVHEEVDLLVWQIGVGSLVMIMISITVGAFLARKFLTPIGELASGMKALNERRFEVRVQVLDRDEFGDLSQAFNAMIEGMGDLEVARVIQESLFPRDALQVGNTGIFGTCVPASQVGGDYFDYFALPGERLGVLIGDVSGHGVGAAMVMSMAKGMVSHVAEAAAEPNHVLDMINKVLFKTLKRSRMMSCLYAVIEPANRRLIFSNGGHNDPYLVRNGTVSPIELHNFPLGSRSKAVYKNATLDLQPGDRVLFYTDGFVEAFAKNGQQIGYERVQAVLPQLAGQTPRAGEALLRTWFYELAAPGPQADDITVLVLAHD